jgi:hypothetical protein
MAKTQIKNYVFKPGLGASGNLFPNSYSLINANKSFIKKEATAWIADQVAVGAAGFVGYTYNQEKCERDIGYNIDAYLKDLRYGGNENTRNVIKYYWDQDVAQIDGDRQPEIQTYGFIKTLINTYILQNSLYTASNTEVTQSIDNTKTAEVQAVTNVDLLLDNTIDVITNGLSSMPTLDPSGLGTIKIQGRYDLDQLILITNVTANEIIYNFSAPATGGLVSLKTDGISNDADFAKYLQATDAITTITLNYDTTEHNATDELQIFIEKIENGKSIVTTRPYDFGTDAIERMRVAQPMSMLDADFEYGLQPTKWAAIGTMRGYPSVYEVPGTDTPVLNVVTDASAGTEGIGQSLITVTTVAPHGFEAGTPITIKALEDSVNGAARAEGSFVIVETPSSNSFTYYAKSKVGTVNPTTLSTTYTQLRQAGFYTGANIGNPDIEVVSNGSAGTLVSELNIDAGSTIIPFDGPSPEVGAPLINANIPEGSQVTTIIDTSAGGGEYLTPVTITDIVPGNTSFDVQDPTGIVPNLAVDRGDGTAIYVNTIIGTTVNMSGAFTAPRVANVTSYTAIEPSPVSSNGSGAIFNIFSSGGTYSLAGFSNQGDNYAIGDILLVQGNLLGGTSPANDLTIRVLSLDSASGIESVELSGTAFDGNITVTNVTGSSQGGQGVNALFDVSYVDNVYSGDISSPDESSGYIVGDVIVVRGDFVDPTAGASPANDVYLTVASIGAGGSIVSLTADGQAPDANLQFFNPVSTTSGAGTGASFTVFTNGTAYSVSIDPLAQGSNYLPNDTITVLGTEIGGTTPANDLTITIDNVGGSGEIIGQTATGTAFNGRASVNLPGANRIGTGAAFDVTLSAGSYTVTLVSPGNDYGPGQTILIPAGTAIPGNTPENDLTITVDTVDTVSSGIITTFTQSGLAYDGSGLFSVPGVIQPISGSNFNINLTRSNGTYSNIVINNGGAGYSVGNRFIITGANLGGQSPINDIDISVTSVDAGTGEITAISPTYESAVPGDIITFISTLIITDPTTGLISQDDTITYGALATLEITLDNAHGLVPGNTFIVTAASDNGVNNHGLASGSFFVTEIPAINKLRYQARTTGAIDTSINQILGTLYPRPDSFFIHRPFDGGVQLGTGGPQHGSQAIRQSKKYIRYQSGKGIMYTTGALFAPSYDIRSLTAEDVEVGSLITVVTDDNDHGVQVGGIVRLLGVETPGYNSGTETAVPPVFDYTVESVVDERTFKIRAQRRLGSTTAVLGFGSQMSVVSWHGATVRSGIFDDQNGIFWEFDGTQISVVQRTGTRQLAGTISLSVDKNLVTGNNTRFEDQLKAGDRIIIKGMTHVVSHVNSQTQLTITPDWRGVVDIVGAKINLIVDKKTKQSDFNLDKLDGTGPSGYNIDIAKMQMIGIQYSWYGAGFIDFMLRGADGNFVFAHRMRNSNVNTEAFMRSGNLPVRYEVTNEGPSGKLAAEMDAVQNFLTLTDSSFFPDYGTLYIDNEIITFSGNNKDTHQLTGLSRAAAFTNFQAGATRSYTAGDAISHTARTGVILISQTITPLISHWGSAFITDGMFDDDRGYIFSYAESGVEVSTTKQSAFLIRLSPSVSNAITGDLGERELLNRAQLLLQGIEVTSDGVDGTGTAITGGIVVEGILNPQNYPVNPGDIGWSGLSGVAQGGQPSFAEVASGGSVKWSTGDAATVSSATAQAGITTQLNSGIFRSERDERFIFIDTNDYTSTFGTGFTEVQGKSITGQNIRSGTTITGGYISGSYGYLRLSRPTTDSNNDRIEAGTANAYTITAASDNLQNRNFAYMDKTSFDACGATVGTALSNGGSVTFPSNTLVNNITLQEFAGTQYYEIQFNNSFSGTLVAGTGTIEFTFVQPPYAQPGETVFSFVATPGERSTLDLSALKELTNTPLGGRGTYPNGPDVLALNIYKVGGINVPANIILRWGEAQA